MIKKSSVRKKIIAALALTTTAAFSTLSLFPIFPSLSSLMNAPLTVNAGDAAGGGAGHPPGGGSGKGTTYSNFGIKFYVISESGNVVHSFKYNLYFGGAGASVSVGFYEGTKAEADSYAEDWLQYKILWNDKDKAEKLFNTIEAQVFNDTSKVVEIEKNGTKTQVFKYSDIEAVITDCYNKSSFKFNKDGLLNNLIAKKSVTQEGDSTVYIQKFTRDEFLKTTENKDYSGKEADTKVYNISSSSLYAKYENNSETYPDHVSLEEEYKDYVCKDVLDGYEDYYRDDIRFPLLDDNYSVMEYTSRISFSEVDALIGENDSPYVFANDGTDDNGLKPVWNKQTGDRLRAWMYGHNTGVDWDGDIDGDGNTGDLSFIPLSYRINEFSLYLNLFKQDKSAGLNLLTDTVRTFNSLSKRSAQFDDQNPDTMTKVQKDHPAFTLVVEPIVDMDIVDNDSTAYINIPNEGHQYQGSFTGYMRRIGQYNSSSTDRGGRYTLSPTMSDAGSGWYAASSDANNNSAFLTFGDTNLTLVGDGTKWGLFNNYGSYSRLFEYYDGTKASYESAGHGLQVYYPSGKGEGTPPPQYEINTYAVDMDDDLSDDIDIPNEPDRPEYAWDEDGNTIGQTNGSPIGTANSDDHVTGNPGDEFQIVKVYADLYRSNDKIDITYSDKPNKVTLNGNYNAGDKFFIDTRSGKASSGKTVIVRLKEDGSDGGYLYNSLYSATVNANPFYYMYQYPISDPEHMFIYKGEDAVVSEDPMIYSSEETPELTRYYTKVENVGYYYMTNASRSVFITDEVDKTETNEIASGYKLLAWNASEYCERDNDTGSLSSTHKAEYSATDWLSLNTDGVTDGFGGYKLNLDFNRQFYTEGEAQATEFRYNPVEAYHQYSRLYENQDLPNHAEPGINAQGSGYLRIDDPNIHTLYLLYVREMPDVMVFGGDPGEPYDPSDSSTNERVNHTPPNGDNPNPSIPHTWTPGKPTGGKTTNGRDPFKLNIVKVYGTINPYTMEVADDVTIYQSSNTYNVNISDEYGRTDVNGDTSPYHLRAYTLTNTTPIDGIPAGTSGAYPSGSGYTASQWADGWQRSGFDYKDTTSDKNANQFAHHGFIDGYDGWSGNDGKTNPEYSSYDTVGDGVKALIPTNKNILDAQTEGHKDITSFQTLMQKHFNSSSSGADTDDRYMIEWTGGSYTKGIQGLYVYPNEGYDKTIYFGDYVDKSSEGTLYLLYLKEDSVVYRSDPLVIPESYITKAFDLNENKITLSGDATALYRSYVGGGGSDDTTGEATHSLMEHRFIFTTEDNII